MMTRFHFNYKEATGTGSLKLDDCAETNFKRFALLGNSVQTITTGAQLLDKSILTNIGSSLKYFAIQVGDGKFTLSTKYTRSAQRDIFLLAGKVESGASTGVNGVQASSPRTVDSIDGYITIAIRTGVNGENPADFETMLNMGESPLPYEPYTGGKPSPTPEYPQEIVSCGKWNEETQKNEIDVQVTGRNLFNVDSEINGYININGGVSEQQGVKNEKHGDYILINRFFETVYIKAFVTIPANEGAWVGVAFYDRDKKFIKREAIAKEYLVAKIPENAFYMIGTYRKYEDGVFQMEYSSASAKYEPYHEPQTVQLQLDEPLRGIGEYKDTITKDGVLRNIKEVVLNGSESWMKHPKKKDNTQAFGLVLTDIKTVMNGMLSDKFNNVRSVWEKEVCGIDSYNNRELFINIEKTKASTVEEFKAWLSENPVTVQYILQEPTLELFENGLGNLQTYNGTTIVSVDSGQVETGIEVEYAVKS